MKLPHYQFRSASAALFGVTFLFLIAMTSNQGWAQTRTIKVINPFPPGGTADIVARLVTEQISRAQRVTFVIENRPGAGTVIGAEEVARATPDGNTLLINTSALLISSHLRKLNFDPLTSFEPICNLTQSPQLLFVNDASPYRTINDFIAAARSRPGALTLSSTGPATSSHISLEKFRHDAAISITYVPF